MIYLAIIILSFAALRLGVSMWNFFTRQWLKDAEFALAPLVSVLIPARNEEKNIANVLQDLLSHDYKYLEIIVYDDMSEDRTGEIVKEFARKDIRVKLPAPVNLPAGWLGKNHACHRLAEAATGDFFLFLDADVRVGKGLVKNALARLTTKKLFLLSLFPVQQMESFSEKITVPLMNWILVSLLPLSLTRVSAKSSFSAANGQFMLFDAGVYRKELFHQALKKQKVEDIAIFRYMKEKGYRVETLLGNSSIRCRMYDSPYEAVQGFSKNVFEFFGGSRLLAFAFGLITTFGFLPIYFALGPAYVLLWFVMSALIRIFVSLASKQNMFFNLGFAPLQQIIFLYVLIKALSLQARKATTWKGRNIDQVA